MHTRETAAFCAAAMVVLALPVAAQQRDFSQVQIQGEKVAGNVHVLVSGVAGNIGVSAGPDGILIVDDQFAPLADKIRASLAEIAPGDPAFVVNTHWHGDHTGGNEVFGPKAVIVAHHNVRKRLAAGSETPGRVAPPVTGAALPELTYGDAITIHFNGEEIRVIHLPPGHTDGDSYVHFVGSNVVHLGDDFFAGRFPFVDLDSGGSVTGLIESIGRLIGELPADVKIIPGHGPVATLDDLKGYHRMLVATTDIIRKAKGSGTSREELTEAGLGEEWKAWSWAFITEARWIEIVWNSLQ
ncbi:MAG TPA: MBL fold metallo-hydrolase [Thermoanaerobaculia bacterium]|nr:MBL fold metallo-hydrolase [Thermoanaerobaculia bacterium]